MLEPDRIARNTQRLSECHPALAAKLAGIFHTLEQEGYRPRIQHAWRSEAEQQQLKTGGTSKLTWGYHNCTTADGTPESLAVDVLDDDAPLASRPVYLLRLAHHAQTSGLQTGIAWGLPVGLRKGLADLIASGAPPDVGLKLGWDPTHVEWVGISLRDAKLGARPTTP